MADSIPMSDITRNPNQPRTTFDPDYIAQLAKSIDKRGLIQPITLRKIETRTPSKLMASDAFKFMIVAGECRFLAHKKLGRLFIEANVVEIDSREMQLLAAVENLLRKDMNPIEEANAFQAFLDQGYTPQQIMDELSLKSTALVTQRLSLLNLAPDIQKLVASGQIAVTMAWGIALVSHARQNQLVRDIATGKLRTSEQVKHAAIALREAEQQIDAFSMAPRASSADLATVTRLEAKIDSIASMVSLGFKDGECVAAQRVACERVKLMADKLVLIRKHILQMEHELRRVATQTEIMLEAAE